MKYHILTLFPEMIEQGLHTSILGRAMNNGFISLETTNIRDFSANKFNRVDDYPYGGGAGMVMEAEPVFRAYQSVVEKIGRKPRTVYLTPQGKVLNQTMVEELALEEDLVLLCGHYEGIDDRVLQEVVTDYISIGDYVLTGSSSHCRIICWNIRIIQDRRRGMTKKFRRYCFPVITRRSKHGAMRLPWYGQPSGDRIFWRTHFEFSARAGKMTKHLPGHMSFWTV